MPPQATPLKSISAKFSSEDLQQRSHAMARTIAREPELSQVLDSVDDLLSQTEGTAFEIDPASRTIASLFGLMEAHQRPQGSDAHAAMAQIQALVQLMKWSLQRSSLSCHHFLTKSLACRGLSTLYFPTVTATWEEMLRSCLSSCLDCLCIFEVNRQVEGALVPYLDEVIDKSFSIHAAVANDFGISMHLVTKELVKQHKPHWQNWIQVPACEKQLWSVVYGWAVGDDVIELPKDMNIQRIDWKQINELNAWIMKHLATSLTPAKQTQSEQIPRSSLTRLGSTDGKKNQAPQSQAIPGNASQSVSSEQGEQLQLHSAELPMSHLSSVRSVEQCERSLDSTEAFLNQLHLEALAAEQSENRPMCSEIRVAGDPQLAKLLEQIVDQCRLEQVSLTLLKIRAISTTTNQVVKPASLNVLDWHITAYRCLKSKSTGPVALAYLVSDGDLVVVFEDLDRTQVTRLARETILSQEYTVATSARTSERCGVACGSATVSCPTRGFSFEQLATAAERCLQGAILQGRGAIKSLEVF